MAKKTTKRSKLSLKRPSLNKPKLQKPNWGIKHLILLIVAVSIGLLGTSGWYWYSKVWADPDRLLSNMIEKSIQTPSIERTVSQKSQQGSVNQNVYLSFSPTVATHSSTVLEQAGRVGEETSVTTETIGTPTHDFIRYTNISVPEKDKKGDFNSVVGQWGKREQKEKSGDQVTFLNEAVFSIVPFGSLNDDQRRTLLALVEESNAYTYDKAERQFQNNRPVMVYEMNIKTENLVRILAKYIELTGVGDSAQLNPEQYKEAPPLHVNFTIDMLSRHLTQIDFKGSGRVEDYVAYGLKRKVELPTQTVSVDELQSRLQKLQ